MNKVIYSILTAVSLAVILSCGNPVGPEGPPGPPGPSGDSTIIILAPPPEITNYGFDSYWKIEDADLVPENIIHHLYCDTNYIWRDGYSGGPTSTLR